MSTQPQDSESWDRCAEQPMKRIYRRLSRAEISADRASKKYGKTIVPYLCHSCGYYHLTSDPAKSDVVRSDDGVLSTNATRSRAEAQDTEWKDVDLGDFLSVTIGGLLLVARGNNQSVRIQVKDN